MAIAEFFKYTVYGLTLQVNRPLPALISASADAPVDVWVDLMIEEKLRLPSADVENPSSGVKLISKADSNYFHLWFRGGDGQLDFELDAEGNHILATWNLAVIEGVSALLFGQVLGCALRLQGTLCLHACVMKMGEHAIAIVGESGAGKSTMAAALARLGHAILSDDIAVLNECDQHWLVQPGYPRLRLWPNSIKALYGSKEGLTRIFSFSEKCFIDLNNNGGTTAWQFHNEPLPLTAIYILGERQPDLAAPNIEAIPSTSDDIDGASSGKPFTLR